ncbi:hypothetical protein ACHQM5_019149 [Ranunculus cassubicifolius]
MGCSASRPETLLSSSTNTIESTPKSPLPSFPKAHSLPTHLVHHPPLRKGDTHHLVSLTSTTYGSLLLIDSNEKNPNPRLNEPPLDNEDYPSPDSVINTWELMAGLDEEFDHVANPISSKSKISSGFVFDDRRCFSFDSANVKGCNFNGKVKNLRDELQYTKEEDDDVTVENVTKPLWQHLSEELILGEMDPNVVNSFRKAESSRKLGLNKKMKPSISDVKVTPLFNATKVTPLFNNRIQLPGTEDRIVIYFTSLRGIRRTYEDCGIVRTIFKGLRVPVDERDISMDSSYRKELQSALEKMTVSLPQVFVRGRYLGGVEEVKQLHEDGELVNLVEGFPVQDPAYVCENCGDARFVPCLNCNGSRKIFVEEEGQLKRCVDCNENGLIRCPSCCS